MESNLQEIMDYLAEVKLQGGMSTLLLSKGPGSKTIAQIEDMNGKIVAATTQVTLEGTLAVLLILISRMKNETLSY